MSHEPRVAAERQWWCESVVRVGLILIECCYNGMIPYSIIPQGVLRSRHCLASQGSCDEALPAPRAAPRPKRPPSDAPPTRVTMAFVWLHARSVPPSEPALSVMCISSGHLNLCAPSTGQALLHPAPLPCTSSLHLTVGATLLTLIRFEACTAPYGYLGWW